jgi:predicted ABC-type ATPase
MSAPTPRLRMIAGPNGSGKSTIKSLVRPEILGVFINPDDIESAAKANGSVDLASFGVQASADEFREFFAQSTLLANAGLIAAGKELNLANNRVDFSAVPVNSYFASVIADFVRRNLLDSRVSFSFETVMSSPDKVELMRRARTISYRTYLYYVATEDPLINVSRVRFRVQAGGHDVPEAKIISRYHRSLDLLFEAIRNSSRAYVFDNSSRQPMWIAEVTDGNVMEMKSQQMPSWFKKAVWDKMQLNTG